MSVKTRLTEDMKQALRSGDKGRLSVVRMALAAIQQREVDERVELDDAALVSVIEKLVKQRQDSVEQYRAGGRDDLADKEQTEIEILRTYLPEPLSEEALAGLIEEAVDSTGADSMKDMGRVMGYIKARAAGQADMSIVSARVRARLSA
ncbi:MAG: GatB/YqeY domain-containing protein [Gammaproteobacteria bacterium]